eukprot:1145885-Pelagomonas_calceolata.AAC.1
MGTWPPVPGCTPTCSKRSLASAIASPGAGSVSMGAWLPPTDWAAACAWGVECSVAQGAAAGLASIGDRPTSLRGYLGQWESAPAGQPGCFGQGEAGFGIGWKPAGAQILE